MPTDREVEHVDRNAHPRSAHIFARTLVACSMFTMFQVFTVEGWNEVPLEIKNAVKNGGITSNYFSGDFILAISQIYFATTMLFGGIFGLSLANAVFVDEMTIDNNEDWETKIDNLSRQLAELKEVMITA